MCEETNGFEKLMLMLKGNLTPCDREDPSHSGLSTLQDSERSG